MDVVFYSFFAAVHLYVAFTCFDKAFNAVFPLVRDDDTPRDQVEYRPYNHIQYRPWQEYGGILDVIRRKNGQTCLFLAAKDVRRESPTRIFGYCQRPECPCRREILLRFGRRAASEPGYGDGLPGVLDGEREAAGGHNDGEDGGKERKD